METLPKKWLIATNGTKYANESALYAAQLYRSLIEKPEVTILHVVEDAEEINSDKTKNILAEVRKLFPETDSDNEHISTLVSFGEASDVILETAENFGSEHLFIGGADFKWKVKDLISGGISNYVLHRFSGTITIVK